MKLKKVIKPWGWELWYAHTTDYAGKIIRIHKGHRLSRQYHRYKHETIYADRGRWILEIGGRKIAMRPGMAVDIPPGTVHRISCPREEVRLLEVSTPQVNDIIRLEDDYGRLSGIKRGRTCKAR